MKMKKGETSKGKALACAKKARDPSIRNGFNFDLQAKSSTDLLKKFKKVKLEKLQNTKARLLESRSKEAKGGSHQRQQDKVDTTNTLIQNVPEVQYSSEAPHVSKKLKRKPMCPPLPMDEFLGNVASDIEEIMTNEEVEENEIEQNEEDNNHHNGVEEENNGDMTEGTTKKRTRGQTSCKSIHARSIEEREEITLNDDGQPIGPSEKTVMDLSFFLGTLARNSTFCPLTYTSWKAIPSDLKEHMWKYVNAKFDVPDEGRKWVESTIQDAWRRHKWKIKKCNFEKFANMTERLKHRPVSIPEPHFKQLCLYWSNENVKKISKIKKKNRATQKWRHRKGPTSFALVRQRMKKKTGEQPTQLEVFIETRQSDKGKQVDLETQDVISQLQDHLTQNPEKNHTEAFKEVLGKEKAGRVRCFGRNVTPTALKQKEKQQQIINSMKQEHDKEMSSLKSEMEDMKQQMSGMQSFIKVWMQQNSSGINMENLDAFFRSFPSEANNNAQNVGGQSNEHSTTHASNLDKGLG